MRCGVGDYCQKLAYALTKDSKNRVAVLTSISGKCEEVNDRLNFFPVIKEWSLTEVTKVFATIRNWAPDIVHIQYPTQGYGNGFLRLLIPMIAFFMGKKVVQTWHEGYSRRNAVCLLFKSIVPSSLVFVRPNFIEENMHAHLQWAVWGKSTVFIPNASSIPQADLDEYRKKDIRNAFLMGQKRLIVFFGFVYPAKGVELLFEIADPTSDQIIIAGEILCNDEYALDIKKLASENLWQGKVTITGHLPADDIATILALADAVILPFRGQGGGAWNTSIHGAVLNGAFVITTSMTRNGYDTTNNVYYASVDNVQEMRSALSKYSGKRREYNSDIDIDQWLNISSRHNELYVSLLSKRNMCVSNNS